jgi:hypothetical protein
VERQLPRLVEKVVEEAERMGYQCRPRSDHEAARADSGNPAARPLGL